MSTIYKQEILGQVGTDKLDITPYLGYLKVRRESRCYACPNCDGKLSVSVKDTREWSCYGCDNRKAIRAKLIELNGGARVFTSQDIKARAIESENRRIADEKREAMRIASLPEAKKLDEKYCRHSEIYALSPINSDDATSYANLIKRGFTPEGIKKAAVYRVKGSYCFPARSLDGLLCPGQVKIPNGYCWVERDGTNHLKHSLQLPLTFLGNTISPKTIYLVEGICSKPHLASERFPNDLIIGAAGGNFAASIIDLQAALDRFPDAEILLCPDGGDIANPGVMRRASLTYAAITRNCRRLLRVLWWNQFTKADGDIDEVPKETETKEIGWSTFVALSETVSDSIEKLTGLTTEERAKKSNKLTVKPFATTQDKSDLFYSDKNDLEQIIRQLISIGVKTAQIQSIPGSGKTHAIGEMYILGFKIIYCSASAFNPATEGIEQNYQIASGRSSGRYVKEGVTTPLGKEVLVSAGTGESRPGNCHLAEAHRDLREKNYPVEVRDNIICGRCPFNTKCDIEKGDGYGYKKEQKELSQASLKSMHSSVLPDPENYDYSKTIVILDDHLHSFSKSIKVTKEQFLKYKNELDSNQEELYLSLRPLLNRISKLFETKAQYGHENGAVLDDLELGDLTSQISLAHQLATLDLGSLIIEGTVKPHQVLAGKSWARIGEVNLKDVSPNFLPTLLEIAADTNIGNIHIQNDVLELQTKCDRFEKIFEACALVIFANGTLCKGDLALILQKDPSEIKVISKEVPSFANLIAKKVLGLGNQTRNQVDSNKNRVKALLKTLMTIHDNVGVIDHFRVDGHGLWNSESVGSNQYKNCDAIILIGRYIKNRGASRREYSLMVNRQVGMDEPEFKAFCRRQEDAAVIQAIGRLRAQHRPDQELTVYLITESDELNLSSIAAAYPDVNFELLDAINIEAEAAKKTVRRKLTLTEAIARNPKLKKVDAVKLLSCSESTIDRMFDGLMDADDNFLSWRKAITLLYRSLYGKVMAFSNAELVDWQTLINQAQIDSHLGLLSQDCSDELKAPKIALSLSGLEDSQITGLFQAIGEESTDYTIYLLELNLILQIPMLEQMNNGSTTNIAEGLRYITKWRDSQSLSALRGSESKEAMQSAAKELTAAERAILVEMVIAANRSEELAALN